MAILLKSTITTKTQELESFYNQLRKVLEGKNVEVHVGKHYVRRREDVKSLVDINIDNVLDAVGHFKVALESLRRLNSSALKPSNSPHFYDEDDRPF